MKLLRFLHHCYASLFGYFWLPCPLCDEYFGGHEWLDDNSLWINYGEAEGVCPNCGEKARELNKKNNYFIPKIIKL